MAFPFGVKAPDLPADAVPPGPAAGPAPGQAERGFGGFAEPTEAAWSRFQPGTARPLGSRSLSRSRHADFGDRYDRGRPGRRDISRPRAAHIPCHLEDAVREMLPDPKSGHPNCRSDGTFDGLYVDCTFGRGGHTEYILSKLSGSGRLIAFDVDPEAVAVARQLEAKDPRFRIAHRPFSELREELRGTKIDGLLVDLGVSSPQLDDRHRGFGVNEESELDLRMNQHVGIPAWQWLQQCTTEELAWVIREHGEDADPIMADRIAETIMTYTEKRKRMKQPAMRSCRELGDIIKIAKQSYDDRNQHPAKLTFQALRMFLNQEMEQLSAILEAACETLKDGGKCVVITFKKKECDAVLKFVRHNEEPSLGRGTMTKARWLELYPLMARDSNWSVSFARNPIRPRDEDIKENPRTRSAIVHVLKKQIRIQQKVTLEDDSAPRATEERFLKPNFLPTFSGADSSTNPKDQGDDEWRPDEWVPQRPAQGVARPKESVFPPPSATVEPSRQAATPKAFPANFAAPPPQQEAAPPRAFPANFPTQPAPQEAAPAVKAFPGNFPSTAQPPQPEAAPSKAFPGNFPAAQPAQPEAAPSKAFPGNFPAAQPPQQEVPQGPPVKAFPGAWLSAQAPAASTFPQASATPVPKAFPTVQTEEAVPPAVKAFPRPSQANPQSPTEQRVRFLDGCEKDLESLAIGECRAIVDLENLRVRRGDLLWIMEENGEWLYGVSQKCEEPTAWFERSKVNVFCDI